MHSAPVSVLTSICGFAYANEDVLSVVAVVGVEWWILGIASPYPQQLRPVYLLPPSSPDAGQAGDVEHASSPPQACPLWPIIVSYLGSRSMLFQIS